MSDTPQKPSQTIEEIICDHMRLLDYKDLSHQYKSYVDELVAAFQDFIRTNAPAEWELYGDKDSLAYHEALGFNKCRTEFIQALTAALGAKETI